MTHTPMQLQRSLTQRVEHVVAGEVRPAQRRVVRRELHEAGRSAAVGHVRASCRAPSCAEGRREVAMARYSSIYPTKLVQTVLAMLKAADLRSSIRPPCSARAPAPLAYRVLGPSG